MRLLTVGELREVLVGMPDSAFIEFNDDQTGARGLVAAADATATRLYLDGSLYELDEEFDEVFGDDISA